jgi:Tol biopolymer transport system component
LTWSRDGKSVIYATGQGPSYLWRVAVHGQRPPERLEIAGFNAFAPSIAAAGNRLVFERRLPKSDIWRYHVGGGMELLIASALNDQNPQFSPDGKKIAFKSDRSGEQFEIWVAEADGSRPVQLTNRIGRTQGGASWSPDSRWIAFSSQREDGHVGICAIEASGGTPRRLSFEGTDEAAPSWSPDGKWIYFRSNRTGHNEIWRLPFSGGPPSQVTESGGFFAYASADGKTLFYQKTDQSSSCCGPPLFAKSLSGGPERQVLPYVYVRTFAPVEDGIYYIGLQGDDGKYPLQFLRFSTNASRLLTRIDNPIGQSISVSPDRKTILFGKSQSHIGGANLFMIENFR